MQNASSLEQIYGKAVNKLQKAQQVVAGMYIWIYFNDDMCPHIKYEQHARTLHSVNVTQYLRSLLHIHSAYNQFKSIINNLHMLFCERM